MIPLQKIEEVSNANLKKIPRNPDLPRTDLPLLPYNILGLKNYVRYLLFSLQRILLRQRLISNTIHSYNTLNQLVDQLESEGIMALL
jgi:hypothetical protein